MANFEYNEGTIDATGLAVVNVGGKRVPMTATLSSALITRRIEFSSDGGANYWTPIYDANTATMCNVGIMSPISHVRFTGSDGDKWNIR